MPHEEFAEGDVSYYEAALAGNPPPLHSDAQIEQGYYRVREGRNGPWVPVMIMIQDDYFVALRNDQPVAADKISSLFRWCCRNPISREAYDRAIEGGGWADEPPAPMGHNLPEDADPLDKLMFEFEAEREQIIEALKAPITDQDQADRIGIWVDRVRTIKKAVDAEHDREKRPVLDEGRRIDARWAAMQTVTAAMVKTLLAHVKPWMDKLEQLERERQETARRNAEMLRQKAQEMASKAGSMEEAEEAGEIVAQAQAATREAERRNPQAGRTHAKIAMRTKVSALITDYAVALNHVKDSSDIRSVVQSMADAAARAKNPMPGTQRIESREPA
jgi:hypothetical protein